MSIVPTLFLGVEYCATFQAALFIETHSLMHQSEFHAASVALLRAADKRKSLINIHKNGYTATLIFITRTYNENILTLKFHIYGTSNCTDEHTHNEHKWMGDQDCSLSIHV